MFLGLFCPWTILSISRATISTLDSGVSICHPTPSPSCLEGWPRFKCVTGDTDVRNQSCSTPLFGSVNCSHNVCGPLAAKLSLDEDSSICQSDSSHRPRDFPRCGLFEPTRCVTRSPHVGMRVSLTIRPNHEALPHGSSHIRASRPGTILLSRGRDM